MNTVFKNVELNGKITDITAREGKIIALDKTTENGLDCTGLKAYPGLIDTHIHGCGGCDTMDGDKLADMSRLLASKGVTAWYPTTMTASHQQLLRVTSQNAAVDGAAVCGFHLEGPYMSPDNAGVQNTADMRLAALEEFKQYSNVKIVTIAPELEGSYEFIEKCPAVVSLGHTTCTYDQAAEAFDRGAKCVTHIFNAMPPFHHRQPSLIGAAMDKGAYAQVICDGVHLHKSVVLMLYKTFGADRLVLISDSTRAAGMPDGTYELGGRQITLKDKMVTDSNETIAGSGVFLGDCIKKAIEFGIEEKDAVKMATETPARMMGLNKGRIDVGYDCDMILVNREQLIYTIVGGKVVYDNKKIKK